MLVARILPSQPLATQNLVYTSTESLLNRISFSNKDLSSDTKILTWDKGSLIPQPFYGHSIILRWLDSMKPLKCYKVHSVQNL